MISFTPTPSFIYRTSSAIVFLFPIPNSKRVHPTSNTSSFRTRCFSAGSGLQEASKSSEERKLSSDVYSSMPLSAVKGQRG
ncbi:hypothetical protein ACFX1X_028102 [Malus domestica]